MVEKICWPHGFSCDAQLSSLLTHSGWNFLVDKPPDHDKVNFIEGAIQVCLLTDYGYAKFKDGVTDY